MTPRAPLLSHLALWTALLAPGVALAQASATGMVDSKRAALDCAAGKSATDTLKKLFDGRQDELSREQKQLEKEKESIEKERSSKSSEALQKKVEAWQTKVNKLQSRFVVYTREQDQQRVLLFEPIERDVYDAIKRVAAARGFAMVVERSAVPYARADLDITDDVIKLVNAGPGAKK
jgi:outer membrane protein